MERTKTRTFYKKLNLFGILLFYFHFINSTESTTEAPKDNCKCEWTPWMNSDRPDINSNQYDDETYDSLRKNGYEFCEKPVEIRCFNIAFNKEVKEALGSTCDVDSGFLCNVFCDDYKIKVKCCYCPPPSAGPEFLIESQSTTGSCLSSSVLSSNSTFAEVDLATPCNLNTPSQRWSWVSRNQLKNNLTQQCLAVTSNQVHSSIVTVNCDEKDVNQEWGHDKHTHSLSHSISYINSDTAALTQSVSKSHWQGRVKIGASYLDTFQEFPCRTTPQNPDHGSVSCSFGSYVGSECSFSCDYGYTLPPKSKYPIVCMKNQLFNGSDPLCERVICNPPITTHLNGNVQCSNENYQGSNCLFSCNEGYSLASDNKQSFCEENGEWDNYPAPTCNEIMCGVDLEKQGIENGSVNCSNANSYNSACTYSCSNGFELIGSQLRVCMRETTWTKTKPICQKIECNPLDPITNGEINCTNRNYYMSECQYGCDIGYTVVGSASTVCNADKEWGSPAPTCKKKTCSVLEAQEHGSMSCSDGNFFNSVCKFACNKAYKIEGESSLTCTALGWDYGSPSCIRIVCTPHFLNPISGNVQCEDGDYFDSICHFSCQSGYEVKGSKAAQCMADGSWNATSTTCQKQLCEELSNPKNGQVVCNAANEFNSVCFYNCNEGFTKSDTSILMCGENGKWSGPPQTCQRIKCRKLTFLRKGSVTCSDKNNYKSNCTFKCNAGFNLYGATETFCGTSGWDAQVPTCGRVLCTPPLARPANGQVKCSTRGVLNCTFLCDKGFHLDGNSKTYCQPDETWSNTETPVCQKIECQGDARTIAHGSMDCTNANYYGSQCTFTCNKGYTLEGDAVSQCTDQGTWDLDPPVCQRISCPERNSLTNGAISCTDNNFYDSTCTFSCNTGYVLIGLDSAKCFLDENWSQRLPYCERITCSPSFSNPSNGRVTCSDANNFASVCTFHCEEGFSMKGDSTTQCSADGWSNVKAPSCKKITCPEEKSISVMYGSESCDRSNDFESLCEYTCNTGYEVQGESSRWCSKKGTWSSPKPTCSKVQCPALQSIENGVTLCKDPSYGTECVFLCNDGYVIDGQYKTICGADKQWNPPDLPICNSVTTTTTATTTTTTTTTIPVTNSTIKSTTTTTSPPKPTVQEVTTTIEPNTTTTTIMPPTNVVDVPLTTPVTIKPSTLPDVVTGNKQDGGTAQETIEPPAAAGVPMVPIIIGVVVAILVLFVVIGVVMWRRRSKNSKYGNGITTRGLSKKNNRYDESEVMKLVPSNGSTNRRYPPVIIDRLESEFNRKHADDDKLFRDEFSHLPESSGSRQEGGKIQNKDKNRYTNITPYDHSRVVLPKSSNINESDYINASFIDGYKHKGKFIAAQGPKEGTTNDFWRMIWDQNVTTIIMVTNLDEGKDSKCAQYWPSSGNSVFGNLRVVHTGENHLVDYTIRQFTVQQVREDATMSLRRNIMHYHFTSWPDFGVPKTPSGMLKFLRKIKHSSPTGYGAIVVHCSAGVGRTGTYICIDSMVDMMLRENKIDVYGFVSQMRNQRPEMVQTEQQYIFIYQALLEHHLYGDTEVEASEVNAHIDELNQRMPGNVTGMEHEFKKLTTIRIQKEQMRAGNHPANMRKNRVLLILPYDWNRVILPVKRGVENSDYINASYIDGYRQKDAYIATQGPLPHTIEDFWRMIWETKSASIVMLTEVVERGQAKCEQYWPAEGTRVFGDINIEITTENELDNYTTRDFVVTNINDPNSPKQIVKQFHYHGWPEVGPPVSGRSMIDLVEQVQKQQQSSGNHPITIHCSAGAGRTGAFCALSTALEQVKAEGVLDMFQIVKCLRMQRPHMVQNLEQYEFCYRAVQEYIDSMCEYYNFK